MATRSIDYVYRILDRFSPALQAMSRAATRFDSGVNRIQGGLEKMQTRLQSTGARLANLQTGLAAVGAGVFLKGALDSSMQFQRSLNLTQAVTGATGDQMETLRGKALEWGAQTQFSSMQVAESMAELGKMGNSVNEIMGLMPGTMNLAAAGELSMADAANFTMAAVNQFGLAVEDATMVADVLAAGASGAATSVGGIASALANAGVQSKLSGLRIDDTTASLMALANSGLEGAEGGTMLMNALKQLQVMPDKVREGFEGMGIDIDQFRDATTGQMKDFFGLIQAMKDAGATGAQLGKMFDVRSMKAMAILVETASEDMNDFRDATAGAAGRSQEMADTLLTNLGPMVQFQSLMENMRVMTGTFVSEALLPLLTRFNEWFGYMQKNNPEMLKLITYVLMGITALGAILVPLGLFISAIGSVIGVVKTIIGLTKLWTGAQVIFNAVMAANPIALAVTAAAALAAVAGLVYANWEPIKAFFVSLWETLKPIIEGVGGFFAGVGGKVKEFFTGGGIEASSPYMARAAQAPMPGMYGARATADASVSVYTEKGLGVVPFSTQGNLGYNMVGSYER